MEFSLPIFFGRKCDVFIICVSTRQCFRYSWIEFIELDMFEIIKLKMNSLRLIETNTVIYFLQMREFLHTTDISDVNLVRLSRKIQIFLRFSQILYLNYDHGEGNSSFYWGYCKLVFTKTCSQFDLSYR